MIPPQTDFAADVLEEIRRQLAGRTIRWTQDVDGVLNSALVRLKDCPPEAATEFALAGLRLCRTERETWLAHVVIQSVGHVLRRKLAFTEDISRRSAHADFNITKSDVKVPTKICNGIPVGSAPESYPLPVFTPDTGATGSRPRNVFLPVEGDHRLSLILSKAFLLADDRKITDQSILRQLPL